MASCIEFQLAIIVKAGDADDVIAAVHVGELLVSMQLAGEDFSSVFPDFRPHPLWGFREESIVLKPGSDAIRQDRIDAWKAKRKVQIRP